MKTTIKTYACDGCGNETPESDLSGFNRCPSCRQQTDIVAAGPITPAGGGCVARRIVLRDLGDEYVTHCELFEADGSHAGFDTGHYFALKERDEAIADWQLRCQRGY